MSESEIKKIKKLIKVRIVNIPKNYPTEYEHKFEIGSNTTSKNTSFIEDKKRTFHTDKKVKFKEEITIIDVDNWKEYNKNDLNKNNTSSIKDKVKLNCECNIF